MNDPMPVPKSRSIKCAKHGFYYVPTESAGCVACLKEQRGSDTSRRSFVTPLFWLIGLSLAGWGGYVFIGSLSARGQRIHEAAVPIESHIDPELVRVPLEAVEALLYDDGTGQFGYGIRIQRATMQLFSSVTVRAPRLLAQRHGGRLVGFANAASHEDVGYENIDMARVRRDWEELRAEVFRDAPWFR